MIVNARIAAWPDRVFTGKVTAVNPSVNPASRIFLVEARFDNPKAELRPGMFSTARILLPGGENAVFVPKTAVLDSGRRQIVFVGGGDGRLIPRDVEVGDRVDDYVEIKEGLSPGERVVTSANFLVDSESQLQGAESMMA